MQKSPFIAKRVALSALLCACGFGASRVASAQSAGINLSWNDCGSAGQGTMTSTCISNAGSQTFFGSFIPPEGVTQLNSAEFVVTFLFASTAVPAWWQIGGSSPCRTSAALTTQYTAPCQAAEDYWGSVPNGPVGAAQYAYSGPSTSTPNSATLRGVVAIDDSQSGPVDPTKEYYAFTVSLTNASTTVCGGCGTPAVLTLSSLTLQQSAGAGAHTLVSPPVGGRNWIQWQEATGISSSTPNARSSWGAIKALYR